MLINKSGFHRRQERAPLESKATSLGRHPWHESQTAYLDWAKRDKTIRFFYGIQHKEQVMPTSFDANIRLVSTKGARQFVRKMIDERLDDQRDTVGIVNDGLMGNRHPMHVLHDARCFSRRHPVVDVIRQNQPKDVRRHR